MGAVPGTSPKLTSQGLLPELLNAGRPPSGGSRFTDFTGSGFIGRLVTIIRGLRMRGRRPGADLLATEARVDV
jgi:hypothetical protein